MGLTKEQLAFRVHKQTGVTKPESRQMVEQLLEIMKSAIAEEDLLISDFGNFHVNGKAIWYQ